MALRITCNKNVKFKIIRIRKGCQYVGYFNYSEHLNWTARNLRLGRGLDIAGIGVAKGGRSGTVWFTLVAMIQKCTLKCGSTNCKANLEYTNVVKHAFSQALLQQNCDFQIGGSKLQCSVGFWCGQRPRMPLVTTLPIAPT